jgi:hypothetical protein
MICLLCVTTYDAVATSTMLRSLNGINVERQGAPTSRIARAVVGWQFRSLDIGTEYTHLLYRSVGDAGS